MPSEALLASAKAAHTMRHADHYGLTSVEPEIDTAKVWSRIKAVQRAIASSDDDPARYTEMGVDIVHGTAHLTGPNEVVVDGVRRMRARYILVCPGYRPAVPDMEGLTEAGFLTSESVFELDRAPDSVVMIGGGPIGIEMAQGLTRLGVRTSVLQKGPRILPRDEPELVDILAGRLRDEGVDLHVNTRTDRVTIEHGQKTVHGSEGADPAKLAGHRAAGGGRPTAQRGRPGFGGAGCGGW